MKHRTAALNAALAALAVAAGLSCAGGGAGRVADPLPGTGDATRASVLRNTSGVPIGVRLRWATQDNVAGYHVYRSSTGIPDSARGDSSFWVLDAGDPLIPQGSGVSTNFDDIFPVAIGETWYYRLTAVNVQGEESPLSAEASVTISPFLVEELLTLSARPGELVSIRGQHLGLYDAATDKVQVPGVEWVSGVGFQPVLLDCSIFSWSVSQIQARIPNGATTGQIAVSIGADTQLTPETFENAAPYVTSLLPIGGDTLTQVQIQGGNFGDSFSPDNLINFATQDEIDPTRYVAWSDTQITFLPPTYRNFTEHALQVKVFDPALGAYVLSNTGYFDLQNAPPVTYLRANPTSGGAPLDVTLSPSRINGPVLEFSFDPNQFPLVEYRYDFEDDGTDDLVMFDSNNVNHQYVARQATVCRLTCVDLDGATSSATVTITPGNNAPTAQINAVPAAGPVPLQVSFDAQGSTDIDGSIVKYEWDFDGDGTFDLDSGAGNKVSRYYNFQGSYDAAVRVTDNDGATDTASITVDAQAPNGNQTIVIRDDNGGYSANYGALIADLNALNAKYDTISYHSTVADSVLGGGYKLALWYRGGPGTGSGTEVEPDVRVWTSEEIDNYLQIMQDGNGVLLFSQNHGKTPDMDAALLNGWGSPGYDYTIVSPGIPDNERRHPWAAGLALDIGLQPPGALSAIPTTPASLQGNATGAAAGAGSNGGAERYRGAGSSGLVPDSLSFPPSRQFCAVGFNPNLLPLEAVSAGFRAGLYLQPNFFGSDCALVSWGNVSAPDANIGSGPAYSHTLGSGKLYVVGYGWAEMSITSPAGIAKSAVLQNMIAWFGTGLI